MANLSNHLQRSLSLSAMVFYGLDTIIDADIYVLVGETAAQAGACSPLAFIAVKTTQVPQSHKELF